MHAPATKAWWRASRVRTGARAACEPVIRTACAFGGTGTCGKRRAADTAGT